MPEVTPKMASTTSARRTSVESMLKYAALPPHTPQILRSTAGAIQTLGGIVFVVVHGKTLLSALMVVLSLCGQVDGTHAARKVQMTRTAAGCDLTRDASVSVMPFAVTLPIPEVTS